MKNPPSLYKICVKKAVDYSMTICRFCKKDFRSLPNNVLFDFYYKMFKDKRLCLLVVEFKDLNIVNRMLSVIHKRVKLLKLYQALIDHDSNISESLIQLIMKHYIKVSNDTINNKKQLSSFIDHCLKIGGFFNEGGWFNQSIKILTITEDLCKLYIEDENFMKKLLDCYHKKIYAEAIYCEFKLANETFNSALNIIKQLNELNKLPNLSGLYTNFSVLFFHRAEYNDAYNWSKEALKLLNEYLPCKIIIDVLRQASKACVMKRKFNQAGLLIRQAISLGTVVYEVDNHPHFADTLLDYGFYLLNFDSIQESVSVYERCLKIRREIFNDNNIHVAIAHEDLAYALYVHEYSSGRFYTAKENADRSICLMERVLPSDHLKLASAKRVKALILEEIAVDMRDDNNKQLQERYLQEAEQLHKIALTISRKTFGEKNVQTAKHYGNLGRLYQSMQLYEEAEKMHLRAIEIKRELLGSEDYEVGLSIGHLASLYNYQLNRHKDAEKLYKNSLEINLKLFGEAYSGLEYDYRGLINAYSKLSDQLNADLYIRKMRHWKLLREKIKPHNEEYEIQPLKDVIKKFFNM